ncbi:MAG TPA: hypothetical protein VN704_01755 [Verrucomicrobiae bacterium]|nr:hypothetical protein [Verrucomicrobiae bacterium]
MNSKFNQSFVRRRWLDFRNGHSIYLAFLLAFINFILITYNFAIKQLPFGIGGHLNLPIFILIFIFIYAPSSIMIGFWHRKHQYSVENETLIRENWVWAWISQYQIRLIKGTTTPKEDEFVMKYLNEILKRTNKHELVGDDDVTPFPTDDMINDITESRDSVSKNEKVNKRSEK